MLFLLCHASPQDKRPSFFRHTGMVSDLDWVTAPDSSLTSPGSHGPNVSTPRWVAVEPLVILPGSDRGRKKQPQSLFWALSFEKSWCSWMWAGKCPLRVKPCFLAAIHPCLWKVTSFSMMELRMEATLQPEPCWPCGNLQTLLDVPEEHLSPQRSGGRRQGAAGHLEPPPAQDCVCSPWAPVLQAGRWMVGIGLPYSSVEHLSRQCLTSGLTFPETSLSACFFRLTNQALKELDK